MARLGLRMLAAGLLSVVTICTTSTLAAAGAPDQLFLFTYRPGPAWKAGMPMAQQDLRPHGQYMARLAAEGQVLAAGGFTDADGGMAIVRAENGEAAERLLAADPAIISGVFQASLRAWRPRFGQPPLVPPKAAK